MMLSPAGKYSASWATSFRNVSFTGDSINIGATVQVIMTQVTMDIPEGKLFIMSRNSRMGSLAAMTR